MAEENSEEDWDDTYHVGDGVVWQPEPEPEEDPIVLQGARESIGTLPALTPSQFTNHAFRIPRPDKYIDEDGEEQERLVIDKFSFDGRTHMLRPYDTSAKRLLLCCGRQVEKCFATSLTQVVLGSGALIQAFDVEVGQEVLSWDEAKQRVRPARVVAKKEVGSKPCLLLTTRQGHELRVATTHPILTAQGWEEAGNLTAGTRVGAIRRGGLFGRKAPDPHWATLLAYFIADGSLGVSGYLALFKGPGAVCDDFFACLRARYSYAPEAYKKGDRAADHRINLPCLCAELEEVGLWGCHSSDKFIPEEVFHYDREHTALFLNRLWACDGSVGRTTRTKYDVEYASGSLKLVRQVQALLWKFGIPTSFRRHNPSADKWSYILRVETRTGIKRFLYEVGALGKSENVPLPDEAIPERNNRDSAPAELVRRYVEEAMPPGLSLRQAGIGCFPRAGVTQDRMRTLVEKLEAAGASKKALRPLVALLDSDLYWDEIESIEKVGKEPCFDIEVEGTHNFLLNGVFTHNSTLLGNILLCYMCLIAQYKALYVSPSATQTKTFSNDRIKDPIEVSTMLKQFTTRMLSQNILEKQFVNRSKLTLRYAYLNADRVRGIPAYMLAVDEIQDILTDNIPVIEECLSHAPKSLKRFVYSGTPKSLDNHLEYLRANNSTQNEWVVPCEACNHWNILGEKNVGRNFLICEKCGKRIYPAHPKAQWAVGVEGADWESFRINQLMVPWLPWKDILYKYKKYSRQRFHNEVLGVAYDSGTRPLTTAQVRAACNPDLSILDVEQYRPLSSAQPLFAGVDWGTGENSYTVLYLCTYVDTRFRVIYAHRFEGKETDPEVQIKLIIEMIRWFNVKWIGTDYGGGFSQNNALIKAFGAQRVLRFQYVAQMTKAKVAWDAGLKRFKVLRTEVMSDIFDAIKSGKCEFFKYSEYKEPHAFDMLSIFSEYNEKLHKIQYTHRTDKPDDSMHAFIYAWLVSMLEIPRPDIIAPDRQDRQGFNLDQWPGPVDQG